MQFTVKDENENNKQAGNQKASKFAERLAHLRKNRGISQKKASGDLGISQALLSHYEKGIRECGLEFVIRCSAYYDVTTDYLLGVSDNRNGLDVSCFSDFDENDTQNMGTVMTATKILMNTAAVISQPGTTKYVYDYYMLSLYRVALSLAKAGALPKEMFRLDYTLGRELASAAIALQDAKVVFIEDKSRTGPEIAEKNALHSLIEAAETFIMGNFILDL